MWVKKYRFGQKMIWKTKCIERCTFIFLMVQNIPKELKNKYFTCIFQKKAVILQRKMKGGIYDRFTTER